MAPPQAPPAPRRPVTPAPTATGKKKSRLPAGMDGNTLEQTEDIAAYVNAARAVLFSRARELEAVADDLHSAAVVLKRRLAKAEKEQQKRGLRERYQSRSHVARTMRPLFRAARAAGSAADAVLSSGRILRRFWISWQGAMEDLVPRKRGERR